MIVPRCASLFRSLYGVKHEPKKWNERLTWCLLKVGFIKSKSDYSLNIKQYGNVFVCFTCICVDDIVLIGTVLMLLNMLKKLEVQI